MEVQHGNRRGYIAFLGMGIACSAGFAYLNKYRPLACALGAAALVGSTYLAMALEAPRERRVISSITVSGVAIALLGYGFTGLIKMSDRYKAFWTARDIWSGIAELRWLSFHFGLLLPLGRGCLNMGYGLWKGESSARDRQHFVSRLLRESNKKHVKHLPRSMALRDGQTEIDLKGVVDEFHFKGASFFERCLSIFSASPLSDGEINLVRYAIVTELPAKERDEAIEAYFQARLPQMTTEQISSFILSADSRYLPMEKAAKILYEQGRLDVLRRLIEQVSEGIVSLQEANVCELTERITNLHKRLDGARLGDTTALQDEHKTLVALYKPRQKRYRRMKRLIERLGPLDRYGRFFSSESGSISLTPPFIERAMRLQRKALPKKWETDTLELSSKLRIIRCGLQPTLDPSLSDPSMPALQRLESFGLVKQASWQGWEVALGLDDICEMEEGLAALGLHTAQDFYDKQIIRPDESLEGIGLVELLCRAQAARLKAKCSKSVEEGGVPQPALHAATSPSPLPHYLHPKVWKGVQLVMGASYLLIWSTIMVAHARQAPKWFLAGLALGATEKFLWGNEVFYPCDKYVEDQPFVVAALGAEHFNVKLLERKGLLHRARKFSTLDLESGQRVICSETTLSGLYSALNLPYDNVAPGAVAMGRNLLHTMHETSKELGLV